MKKEPKFRRPRKFTEEQIAEYLKQLDGLENLTLKEIGEKLGVSLQSAINLIKLKPGFNRINRRPKPVPKPNEFFNPDELGEYYKY